MIEHGETGWLVSPGDFNDIAGRCAVLLADPALRRRLGERARLRAVERLDLNEGLARVGGLMARLAGVDAKPAAPLMATPPQRVGGWR